MNRCRVCGGEVGSDGQSRFDPTRQIQIIWDIADVQDVRPGLTDEQAMKVLGQVDRKHDATQGVSWFTLEFWADELYPKKED